MKINIYDVPGLGHKISIGDKVAKAFEYRSPSSDLPKYGKVTNILSLNGSSVSNITLNTLNISGTHITVQWEDGTFITAHITAFFFKQVMKMKPPLAKRIHVVKLITNRDILRHSSMIDTPSFMPYIIPKGEVVWVLMNERESINIVNTVFPFDNHWAANFKKEYFDIYEDINVDIRLKRLMLEGTLWNL